jgi:ABC-type antimicrobial peptide transport system permease subunit
MARLIKNLWRRRTRTLLTALGIGVGVAAVIALSAFGEGMARGFSGVSASSDADLVVSQKDALLIMLGAIDESVGAEIAQIRGVEQVAGSVVGIVQTPESPYFLVSGEDPRSFAVGRYRLIAGRPLSARRQVLLGKIAAKNFKKSVGDTFQLNDAGYKVVGQR